MTLSLIVLLVGGLGLLVVVGATALALYWINKDYPSDRR